MAIDSATVSPHAMGSGPACMVAATAHALLCITLALARPSSAVPLAYSEIRLVCDTGPVVPFAWRNTLLLGRKIPNPSAAGAPAPSHHTDSGSDSDTGEDRHLHGTKLGHLGSMLKLMLPSSTAMNGPCSAAADGFSPSDAPAHPDPVFTPAYLRYLYTRALRPTSAPKDLSSRPLTWWDRTKHFFVLPFYLLRAGQLESLTLCPELITMSSDSGPFMTRIGFSWLYWVNLFLDDRIDPVRICKRFERGSHQYRNICFPQVLAIMAMFEWSLPSLELVLAHFPSFPSLALADYVVQNGRIILKIMFATLAGPGALPDNVDRIIDMYLWLQRHGLVAALDVPLAAALNVTAGTRTPPLEYVKRILVEIDIPHLNAAAADANRVQIESFRSKLADTVISGFDVYGEEELLAIALEHGLMGRDEWARLLPHSIDKWLDLVQQNVSDAGERRGIVVQALHYSIQFDRPLSTARFAHMAVVDFGVDVIDVALFSNSIRSSSYNNHYSNVVTLLTSLHDLNMLPNPTSLLSRTLSLLQSKARPPDSLSNHLFQLCVMAAMLLDMGAPNNTGDLPDKMLLIIDSLPASHRATLVAAVLVATSLNHPVIDHYLSLDCRMASAKSLVSHAPTTTSRTSFFDRIPLTLRVTVSDMIRDLVDSHHAVGDDDESDDHSSDWYRHDFDFARQMLSLLAGLDEYFVVAAVNKTHWRLGVPKFVRKLLPWNAGGYAKVSRKMATLMASEDEETAVFEYWELVEDLVDKDRVEKMVVWTMEMDAHFDGEGQLVREPEDVAAVFQSLGS